MSAGSLDADRRWNTLVSLATLGTGRATLPSEGIWPDEPMVPAGASSGAALLRMAAANHLWRLAGTRASPVQSPERDRAPAVSGRLMTEAAAWRLARMLAGEALDLVPEWFECAMAARRVLPPHWLPVVLPVLDSLQRQRYAPVLGARAAWLAAQKPEWSAALPEGERSEDVWATGALGARAIVLALERRKDPARAREWVEQSWSRESAEARAAFVDALRTGLSLDDEPLLERALDDSRKSVRTAAAECLSRLPGSSYSARAIERVRPHIQFHAKGGILGRFAGPSLEVRLPDALEPAALRDGIDAKPPAKRAIGERAWWLMQMVARVPPSFWTSACACDATAFVRAASSSEYGADLIRALIEATLRHPADDWIAALSTESLPDIDKADASARLHERAALLNAATSQARERAMSALVRELGAERFDSVLVVFSRIEEGWGPEATQAACTVLAAVARRDKQQWSRPRHTLAFWGLRADLDTASSLLPPLLDSLPAEASWRKAIEALNDTIAVRMSMREELLRD